MATPQDDRRGERLAGGRFVVRRRLAAGGMGEVLLCDSRGSSQVGPGLVVIKRTFSNHPNRQHQNNMMREEARIAIRLRHANLVETFALIDDDDEPLMSMEYLAGRSVAQVLSAAKKQRKPVPLAFSLAMLRAAACGLHFAHTLRDGNTLLGLVHRDVSPANIFVTFDGRVKVIDFGVAKADDSLIKTSTGILKGKLGYMAPETRFGRKLRAVADIWGLGVVFWESLLAKRLFRGGNPAATLRAIASAEIPKPSSLRPDLPPAIDDLVFAMLERDEDKRLQSCAELVERIDALSILSLTKAEMGGVLTERFAADAKVAAAEIRETARSQNPLPIPVGLVDGGRIGDDVDADARTVVVETASLAHLIKSADIPDHEIPKTMVVSPSEMGALIDVEDQMTRIDTPIVAPQELAPPMRDETSPAKAPKRRTTKVRKPQSIGAVTVAFGTFGLLALVMGLGFSIATNMSRTIPGRVIGYYQEDGRTLITAHLQDVPKTARDSAFAIPFARLRPLPIRKGGPWKEVSPDKFSRLLKESQIWRMANLPKDSKQRRKLALPPLIALLGLLSLAIALPGYLWRGTKMAAVMSALLVVSLLAIGLYFAQAGAFGWPGTAILEQMDSAPARLILEDVL